MKIAINGFGRIGRIVARHLFTTPEYRKNLQLVAINDLAGPKELAFALKHDTTHGLLPLTVTADEESITVDGQRFVVLKASKPEDLAWKNYGVDVVFECTGRYTDKEGSMAHIRAGAKKVIISAPAKGVDLSIVMGVNHKLYDASKHQVVSNASCTTNCLAPVAYVLNKKFGIKHGLMTTVHSYTNDQRILDNLHKDPRRARTAAQNMIPTTTGAAKTVGEVIPELKGKLDGLSVRVPTPNVSFTDFVANLNTEVSKEDIVKALEEAAQGELKGFLAVSHEPLVSSDYNGNTLSSIVDAACTYIVGGNEKDRGSMVKVCSWYDNETGFSCRMLDLASYMASKA
jgi:glyceraldehyde 3-phosphate dehydrogenase